MDAPRPNGRAGLAGRRKAMLQFGGSALVLAVVFFLLLPRIIDYGEVWDAITGLSLAELAVLALLTLVKWVGEGAIYASVLPGLGAGRGMTAYLSSTAAVNTVPGPVDLAVRYGMYRAWGFPLEQATAAVAAGGIFSTFSKLALPSVALVIGLFAAYQQENLGLYAIIGGGVLVVAVGVVVTAFRSEEHARRLGDAAGRFLSRITRRLKRPPVTGMGDQLAGVVRQSSAVVRRRWPFALGASIVAIGANAVVLVASIRFAGVPADVLAWVPIFAAFATVGFLTVVPITSGNVGITELVYIGTLGAIAGADYSSQVAAGVFVYRVFTWLAVIPIGWLTFGLWQALRRRRGETVDILHQSVPDLEGDQ